MKKYRVIRKHTSSWQGDTGYSWWWDELLFEGSLQEAKTAYQNALDGYECEGEGAGRPMTCHILTTRKPYAEVYDGFAYTGHIR